MCKKCHPCWVQNRHVYGLKTYPICPVCRKCAWHTKFPVYRKYVWNVTYPVFLTHTIFSFNATYPVYRKCAWNSMCTGPRKYAWNCALYCIRKCLGNVEISCVRKCAVHVYPWTGNVNYPAHFLGFPNPRFLPVNFSMAWLPNGEECGFSKNMVTELNIVTVFRNFSMHVPFRWLAD